MKRFSPPRRSSASPPPARTAARPEADPRWRAAVVRRTLAWYRRHRRDLPWRRNADPYAVWLSEIMLQQTQVETVIPYFQRFLRRFPDVQALAEADLADVLRLWEGLGYYRRARRMHEAAAQIARGGGIFPETVEQWRRLPGVGRYTAGAIVSIAGNRPAGVLEGNTIRLYSRLVAHRGDPRRPAAAGRLWRLAEMLVPPLRPGDFNQAAMEIGSQVCLPRAPRCGDCPLRSVCRALELGSTDRIPSPARRPRVTVERQWLVAVARRGRWLLRRCGADERWAGLWDWIRFPRSAADDRRDVAERLRSQFGLEVTWRPAEGLLRQTVTRFRLEIRCLEADAVRGRLPGGDALRRWMTPQAIDRLPLNVTARRWWTRQLRPRTARRSSRS